MTVELAPTTFEEAGAALAAASDEGYAVRIRGGGTKLGWGNAVVADHQVQLRTTGLSQILEHNVGDLTAVVEAGASMDRLQRTLAAEGQMLALDPPLGVGIAGATIGGVIATADSGPLRHRYGGARDLVLGITVALSDGTIARAGGKVIKNVAGYDLGKLFTGSFGTLGLILSVSVRLHPLPTVTATALGASSDPEAVSAAAQALAGAPLELDSLDVSWRGEFGAILARAAGAEAERRAGRVAEMLRARGLEHVELVQDDQPVWARQRAGQRSSHQAIVKIAARPHELGSVLSAVNRSDGTLVGRAALGISFVEIDPQAIAELCDALPSGAITVLLDLPRQYQGWFDPWSVGEGPALELMRRVKGRFDPAGACNPGVFVGRI
jgi:glycolate oxidase FAD binding subunit